MSVMVNVAVRVPACVGANKMLIVQAAPAARLCGQVFVSRKAPVITMLLMVKAVVPLFVRLSVWAALVVPAAWVPNVRLEAESDAKGWATPVPVSRIIWGLSGALSVRVSASTLEPVKGGVKVTPITQFDGGVVAWRGTAQPLLWTAKAPLAIALVRFSAAVPVFVTVRNWGELARLTA